MTPRGAMADAVKFAVNCCKAPFFTVAVAGTTSMEVIAMVSSLVNIKAFTNGDALYSRQTW